MDTLLFRGKRAYGHSSDKAVVPIKTGIHQDERIVLDRYTMEFFRLFPRSMKIMTGLNKAAYTKVS